MGNKRSKLAEPRFLSWHESANYATGILERIAKEVHVSSRDTNSVNANIHRRMGRSFSDDRAATGTPENIDKRSIISRNKRLEDFLHEVLNVIHVYGVHSEEMGKYSIGFYFDDNSLDHHRVCVTFCLSDGVGIFDNVEDREDIKLGKKRFRYSRCLNNKEDDMSSSGTLRRLILEWTLPSTRYAVPRWTARSPESSMTTWMMSTM